LITVMRQRLAAGEQVARMYQEPGLAWLERQAEVAEDLFAERQAAAVTMTLTLAAASDKSEMTTESRGCSRARSRAMTLPVASMYGTPVGSIRV
jgi:hypothetical protein